MADLQRIKQLADDNNLTELRQIAVSQGLSYHPRHKAQTVAKLILDHVANPVAQQQMQMKHPAETLKLQPMKTNTVEEITAACKAWFDKPGFEAKFYDDETWHFRYKGAEDSGHRSIPLRVIRMKAEGVSRGAIRPMGMKGFDPEIARNPQSQYTNTVLTV